jgi:hypothetical protein
VSTTVADKGEEPVTVSSAVEAASAPTTSRVELRSGSDKPEVRSLTSDESQKLSDAKFSATKPRATATPTQGAAAPAGATTRPTPTPTNKSDVTTQPAATARRTPSPLPTRR